MNDVSRLLNAIDQGDPQAASQLLPLVYEELRRLAAQKLAQEAPGHTLQPTALVHEAYLRLLGQEQRWDHRGHFFASCAEAMRRILVESARRRKAQKRGGEAKRVEWNDQLAIAQTPDDDLLALDAALNDLEQHDPQTAQLVKLRTFSGLSHQQTAEALGITRRQADRLWSVARAWLYQRIQES
jgi:RNA polymerase sigma factor (TIGR02999 family)